MLSIIPTMDRSVSFRLKSAEVPKPTTSIDLTNHLSARGTIFLDDEADSSKNKHVPSSDSASVNNGAGDLSFDLQSLITSELNSVYPLTLNQEHNNQTSNLAKFIEEKSKNDKIFFIFTSAGKLVFSQLENEAQAMGLTGIIHTVMNYFVINEDTTIKQVSMYNEDGIATRFVFLDKNHIKLMVKCDNNYESTAHLLQQLDFVYSYIISSVSQRNLNKMMAKRENFDLQHYFTDLDQQLLHSLCDSLSTHPRVTWFSNSLECLPMVPKTRHFVNSTISSTYTDFNISNHNGQILYTLVTTLDLKLISILRPSNHTLHTVDLHILFEVVRIQLTDLLLDKVLWFPICFPKFNDNGFLYALIKMLPNDTIIMVISSQKDAFDTLNDFVGRINKQLAQSQVYESLEFTSIDWYKKNPYINHFIYKLKGTVQIYTPFQPSNEMLQCYTHLRNLTEDDQGRALSNSSVVMLKWKSDKTPGQLTGVHWATERFELFILLNDINLSNRSILKTAKSLIQQMRDIESYLFISKGVTF